VTGGVEQVDHAVAVGELHHRRRDGDPALLLEGHPVRVAERRSPGLHRADTSLRGASGVTDDGEGPAPHRFQWQIREGQSRVRGARTRSDEPAAGSAAGERLVGGVDERGGAGSPVRPRYTCCSSRTGNRARRRDQPTNRRRRSGCGDRPA
jgi:hypothetical protein